MSATNRTKEKRDPLDFNRTPAWAVRAALPYFGRPLNITDLGCGDGAIGAALREVWGTGVSIVGFDAHEGRADEADRGGDYDEAWHADILGADFDPSSVDGSDLVISNPPFARAIDFLDVALKMARPGGLVAFLLRATWVVPAPRADIPKPDLLFLRRRPSFKTSAKGSKTDSCEYAWHTWRVGDPMHGGRWAVLDCEPARKPKVKP